MRILRLFLPNDTRLVELVSGWSLVIGMSISMITSHPNIPSTLLYYHMWQFWTVIIGMIGIVQVVACAFDNLEYVRSTTNWMVGWYWIWIGLDYLTTANNYLMPILSIVVGTSCMYAFIINILLARSVWKI